jgi:hypothetical protein
MLKNPNNGPNAVFVPRPDGSFRRFDATTGRPMDHQKNGAPNGLYDQNGKLFFGAMPPDLACDAMPSLWDKTADPKPPGSRDQDTGGSQKISRSSAQKAWAFAKDRLSPEDLEKLIEYLNGLVDPDLPDDAEDESGPVQFAGVPKPGGSMVSSDPSHQPDPAYAADAALRFDAEFPGVRRLANSDTHYGEPVPPTRKDRQARLALDSASRGQESASDAFAREWPEIMKIGRAY